MTSADVLKRIEATMAVRFPRLAVTSGVRKVDDGRGSIAWISLYTRANLNSQRHEARGPTPGSASAALAKSLGVNIGDDAPTPKATP